MHSSTKPIILAIESSCDETAASVCINGHIHANIIASQKVHEQYGGVVPELASRAHLQNIVPVVDTAIQKAGISINDIDAVAFTQAPGLIGSLLVGGQFAKSLSLSLNKPLIAVHHMQAHVLANLIPENKPQFPFLCLTVSGGHTQIVCCTSPLQMEVLGETIDDAAGEAFDKAAKLLQLPYPGGPLIDKHAKDGNPLAYRFPEPKIPALNFSFSGVKTAFLYFLRNAGQSNVFKPEFVASEKEQQDFINNNLADICASIQHTIVVILINKLIRATKITGIKNVCIAGGVSANSYLRQQLVDAGKINGWQTYIPPFEYCTDNAAMIAITAHYKFLNQEFSSLQTAPSARAKWT